MTDKTPLWRIPALWLVIALPAIAIIAGVGLVIVAIRAGGADTVSDPVQRTAQIQVADLGPDALARERRLSAVLRSQDGVVELLPVTGEFPSAAPLMLAVRHPTRAALDRTLVLAPTSTGWRTAAALDEGHDWNVEARDEAGSWRIVGRLPRAQHAARLDPALGAGDSP